MINLFDFFFTSIFICYNFIFVNLPLHVLIVLCTQANICTDAEGTLGTK